MNKPRMQPQPDPILMSDPRPIILEYWAIEVRDDVLYIVGEIYGHTAFKNGTFFRTPPVKWLHSEFGIARTDTEVYILRNRR